MGLDMYLTAFWNLTTCRPVGFGSICPIPWSAINEYAVMEGLDSRQTEDLVYFTRALDIAYLDHRSKQPTKGSKK